MNSNGLCSTVGRSLPPLFVCSEAEPEGVRVRTPMLYPDGGVVDVFVLPRGDGYVVTDFGDALGWLWLQSVSPRRSARQEALARDVCQTLRIELCNDQLVVRGVTQDALGEAVVRVAQAAVQVSDRSQAFQAAADKVEEWLREQGIPFQRDVSKQGRSAQEWTVNFETQTDNRTGLVFLLSAGSRETVHQITEHVVAGCIDLRHLKESQSNLEFVSLFDDTVDVWRPEDFSQVDAFSRVARWSAPDEFHAILAPARAWPEHLTDRTGGKARWQSTP